MRPELRGNPQAPGPPKRYPQVDTRSLFYGSGTGGQLVVVMPSDDLVIVHRGDTDHGRNIAGRDAWRIVELIRVAPGVKISFERDASGAVAAVSGSIGPQQFRAKKRR